MADKSKIGKWAFVFGIVIAVLATLPTGISAEASAWVLVVLGLVVGFLNVTAKESTEFLVATLALILIGNSASIVLGSFVAGSLGNIATFIAPAGLVVALKAIYVLGED